MTKKYINLYTLAIQNKDKVEPIICYNTDTAYIEVYDYNKLNKYINSKINKDRKLSMDIEYTQKYYHTIIVKDKMIDAFILNTTSGYIGIPNMKKFKEIVIEGEVNKIRKTL